MLLMTQASGVSHVLLSPYIKLSDKADLPRVGLGTFKANGEELKSAVVTALRSGIQHIDTAAIYKNGARIAEGLKQARCPRSLVFITSKISPYQHGKDKATAAVTQILQELDTDYLDLALLHWPGAAKTAPTSPENARLRLESWRVLEELYQHGRLRAIGVSNYEERHLQELMALAHIKPMVNQVEVHPRWPQTALRARCDAWGVAVVAYASLGTGELLQNPVVMQVAQDCVKTPAQVLLRWGLQKGCAVIPKSVHAERIAEFAGEGLLQWQLEAASMAALDGLEDGHKYCWDPSGVL